MAPTLLTKEERVWISHTNAPITLQARDYMAA